MLRHNKGWNRRMYVVVRGCAALCLAVMGLVGASAAPAAAQVTPHRGLPSGARPMSTARAHGSSVRSGTETIKYWSGSFTYQGTTYPYTMVGTDPAAGSKTTSVPVKLVPLRLVFADGTVLDGSAKAGLTIQSPMFQTTDVGAGTGGAAPHDVTQVADAIQRAEFASYVSTTSPGYHVLLGGPGLLATQTLHVPADKGFAAQDGAGENIGLVDYGWFDAQLGQLMSALNIKAVTLPVFLTNNTVLYIQDPANCCVFGYHGAAGSVGPSGKQQVQTYIFASYLTKNVFGLEELADIDGLSHEVSEWMNDPFVNNVVPPWSVPSEPQYGCTPFLETGDPLVTVAFALTMSNGVTYHPQDEAFLSWFARQVPSIGYHGHYTYLATFPDVAPGC
jgi:hypothetical protein